MSRNTLLHNIIDGKTIIGRKDEADFPDLGLERLRVKIDTGAYTSSIHCHDIKEISRNGRKIIQFRLLDPSHPNYEDKILEVSDFERKVIKSSNGIPENRVIINSTIRLFKEVHKLELSLNDRENMRFPVLLGRKLLEGKFMVDVAKTNLSKRFSKLKK